MGRTHRQKDQDVTFGLSGVYLKYGRDCSMKIVRFWLRSIVDVDRIASTRNYETQIDMTWTMTGKGCSP